MKKKITKNMCKNKLKGNALFVADAKGCHVLCRILIANSINV